MSPSTTLSQAVGRTVRAPRCVVRKASQRGEYQAAEAELSAYTTSIRASEARLAALRAFAIEVLGDVTNQLKCTPADCAPED